MNVWDSQSAEPLPWVHPWMVHPHTAVNKKINYCMISPSQHAYMHDLRIGGSKHCLNSVFIRTYVHTYIHTYMHC